LTGYADLESAIAAVNEGNIFRFLTKPCSSEILKKTLEDCVKQFKLIRSEKELLQGTLKGAINVLTDVLSLTNPEAFGRSSRTKKLVKKLAENMGLKDIWKYELAAMLSQIGCVILPQKTMQKICRGQKLEGKELSLYSTHPKTAQSLLQNIPRMTEITKMIAYQNKNFNGGGLPNDNVKDRDIPVGSRILKVALDFDLLINTGMPRAKAFIRLKSKSKLYDPIVLRALETYLGEKAHYEVKELALHEISPNMFFGQEVTTNNNILLVTKGQEANRTLMQKLYNFAENYGIPEPIKVLCPIEEN
jgi:HD-GYP domain-containing protein (c-di-GMP phosphodiesterase class II)